MVAHVSFMGASVRHVSRRHHHVYFSHFTPFIERTRFSGGICRQLGPSDDTETPTPAATATAATSDVGYFPSGWTGSARQQSVVTFDENLQSLGGNASRRGTAASFRSASSPNSSKSSPLRVRLHHLLLTPHQMAQPILTFGILPISVPPPTQFQPQSSSPNIQTPLSPTDQSPTPVNTTTSPGQIQEMR